MEVTFDSLNDFGAIKPFSPEDEITAGCENELQTCVIGTKEKVDLPQTILNSNYFKNIQRRIQSGNVPQKILTELEEYLNFDNIWESSWVRFPINLLNKYSKEVFAKDLLKDKKNPEKGYRKDTNKFFVEIDGDDWIRVPVSYLLKIAYADHIGSKSNMDLYRKINKEKLSFFLNDNTSPEITSFKICKRENGRTVGQNLAREAAKRFLLSTFLIKYANNKFKLNDNGQKCLIYFSPLPPVKQKWLNNIISDSFYRDLFMNPCLSGWDEGEKKHEYMHLCHKVLSRSHLNCLFKLKEAGIINNNLVLLPNTSSSSLSSNGTHVSIGSERLKNLIKDNGVKFNKFHEKYYGDLVIKIFEHFIPLFVGNYSASPYKIDYHDFHPEKVLGYLAHELDYTHLRMIWTEWTKKAKIKVFGAVLTPFGPHFLDKIVSKIFRLKGDYVPAYRLIEYLVSLQSTYNSPALDGTYGNQDRLINDLNELGIFDKNMSMYLLYKLRSVDNMGFSGFEGRFYGAFENFKDDMAYATDLQILITSLIYKLISENKVSHLDVPDDFNTESERRKVTFATSIGIDHFYICKKTNNKFLLNILSNSTNTRKSKHNKDCLKVNIKDYRISLIDYIKKEGDKIIKEFGYEKLIEDLEMRTTSKNNLSTADKLNNGIIKKSKNKKPINIKSKEFNINSEEYYRNELREKQLVEALEYVEEDLRLMDKIYGFKFNDIAKKFVVEKNYLKLFEKLKNKSVVGEYSIDDINNMISLISLSDFRFEEIKEEMNEKKRSDKKFSCTSVC